MSKRDLERGKDAGAWRVLRGAMAAGALILPTLSLSFLGVLWLWQNNWLIVWSIAASTVALAIYGVERWLVSRFERSLRSAGLEVPVDNDATRPAQSRRSTSAREDEAWAAVEAIAKSVDPATLTDRDAILKLGTDTADAVARVMHPGSEEAIWRFTVPEALAVVERTSGELSRFFVTSVPFGDRLTIKQALSLWRWRGLVGYAERAYDLYRVFRFVNPATAIAGELRDKVSGQMLKGLRTEAVRSMARAYVREVGRAAIDLYSGRLRPGIRREPTGRTGDEPDEGAPPVAIAIIGQSDVGKSSVVAALARAARPDTPVHGGAPGTDTTLVIGDDGKPAALLIEASTASDTATAQSAVREASTSADAVLVVVSAIRPDRVRDRDFVQSLRTSETNSAAGERPLAIVLTHIDRLRPFKEWSPPYDLATGQSEKAISIREAVAAVAADLEVDPEDVVPIAVIDGADDYNVDVLWAKVLDLLPAAREHRLEEQLTAAREAPIHWGQLWKQSVGAGRVLTRQLLKIATDR